MWSPSVLLSHATNNVRLWQFFLPHPAVLLPSVISSSWHQTEGLIQSLIQTLQAWEDSSISV